MNNWIKIAGIFDQEVSHMSPIHGRGREVGVRLHLIILKGGAGGASMISYVINSAWQFFQIPQNNLQLSKNYCQVQGGERSEMG